MRFPPPDRQYADVRYELAEQFARTVGHINAAGCQLADLTCGHTGTFRQLADFRSDNREPLAVFTGTGGLNGGVEREQVGLTGYFLDNADLVGDFPHGFNRFGYGGTAVLGLTCGTACQTLCLGSVFRILADV